MRGSTFKSAYKDSNMYEMSERSYVLWFHPQEP